MVFMKQYLTYRVENLINSFTKGLWQIRGDIMKKATKNIIKGVGSIIDIAPTRSRGSVSHTGSDRSAPSAGKAIRRDWNRVGNTIRNSMSKISRSNGKRRK